MDERLVLPFIHIAPKSEDTADVSTRTDVGEKITNESRVVFKFNHSMEHNPSAKLDLELEMEHYYTMYCYNMLKALTYNLFGSSSKVYVTHALKRIPTFFNIGPNVYRALADQLENFLSDTSQFPEGFILGMVLDTGSTIHTAYVECEVLSFSDDFVDFGLKPGYVTPWTDVDYSSSLHAFYPIELVPGDLNLVIKGQSNGHHKVRLTSSVAITENKRAIL